MTPRKIRALLVEKGITLTAIAKDLNVSVAAVSMAISRTSGSAKIRAEVAKRLNKKTMELWKRAA